MNQLGHKDLYNFGRGPVPAEFGTRAPSICKGLNCAEAWCGSPDFISQYLLKHCQSSKRKVAEDFLELANQLDAGRQKNMFKRLLCVLGVKKPKFTEEDKLAEAERVIEERQGRKNFITQQRYRKMMRKYESLHGTNAGRGPVMAADDDRDDAESESPFARHKRLRKQASTDVAAAAASLTSASLMVPVHRQSPEPTPEETTQQPAAAKVNRNGDGDSDSSSTPPLTRAYRIGAAKKAAAAAAAAAAPPVTAKRRRR